MDWISSEVVSGILVTLFLGVLLRAGKKAPKIDRHLGRAWLQHPPLMYGLFYVTLGCALLLLFSLIFFAAPEADELLAQQLLFAGALLASLYLGYHLFAIRQYFDAGGVGEQRWWGPHQYIAWQQIEKQYMSTWRGGLVVKKRGGGKMVVSQGMRGFEALQIALKKQLANA